VLMADAAHRIAIELGVQGIRCRSRGVKSPTSLLETVYAVLTQTCAMVPPAPQKGSHRKAVAGAWEVRALADGFAERALHYHRGMQARVALGEYAERDERWRAECVEAQKQEQLARERAGADAMILSQFEDGDPMDVDEAQRILAGAQRAPQPRYDENVLYVPFDAAAIRTCLRQWGADEAQREAAAATLFALAARRAPSVPEDDAELTWLRALHSRLRQLSVRHKIVLDLDYTLPNRDAVTGARIQTEEYRFLDPSNPAGRRYPKGDLGSLPCAKASYAEEDVTLIPAGMGTKTTYMPKDLKTELVGPYLHDKDGQKSDPTIFVILAYLLKLPISAVDESVKYLKDAGQWERDVAAAHGLEPADVKRWPVVLGNGGSYKTCLREAGLAERRADPSIEGQAKVGRMETELSKLRPRIAQESRKHRDALWPGSERFVQHHGTLLLNALPDLTEYQRFNKVWTLLIQTFENKILSIHAKAQRDAVQSVIGRDAFDSLPPEERDVGGLAYDGLLMAHRDGCDPEAGDRLAEQYIIANGLHAQEWDITYKIVEKPLYGKQTGDFDALASAVRARRAMKEAMEAYPEVRAAVEQAGNEGAGS
jgi:hypothetical protein